MHILEQSKSIWSQTLVEIIHKLLSGTLGLFRSDKAQVFVCQTCDDSGNHIIAHCSANRFGVSCVWCVYLLTQFMQRTHQFSQSRADNTCWVACVCFTCSCFLCRSVFEISGHPGLDERCGDVRRCQIGQRLAFKQQTKRIVQCTFLVTL